MNQIMVTWLCPAQLTSGQTCNASNTDNFANTTFPTCGACGHCYDWEDVLDADAMAGANSALDAQQQPLAWQVMGFVSQADCDKHQAWLDEQAKGARKIKALVVNARTAQATHGGPLVIDLRLLDRL